MALHRRGMLSCCSLSHPVNSVNIYYGQHYLKTIGCASKDPVTERIGTDTPQGDMPMVTYKHMPKIIRKMQTKLQITHYLMLIWIAILQPMKIVF